MKTYIDVSHFRDRVMVRKTAVRRNELHQMYPRKSIHKFVHKPTLAVSRHCLAGFMSRTKEHGAPKNSVII